MALSAPEGVEREEGPPGSTKRIPKGGVVPFAKGPIYFVTGHRCGAMKYVRNTQVMALIGDRVCITSAGMNSNSHISPFVADELV